MVIQVLRSLLNIKIIQFQKMKKELGKENQKSPKGLKNKKVNSDKDNKNTSKVLLKNKKAKLDTKILGKHIYQPESEPSRWSK